ncbi:unnamed protein product [Cochlearia groenlandica]
MDDSLISSSCSIQSFVEPWRFNAYIIRFTLSPSSEPKPNLDLDKTHRQNLTFKLDLNSIRIRFRWISAVSEKNFTTNLMRNWLAPEDWAQARSKPLEKGEDGGDCGWVEPMLVVSG